MIHTQEQKRELEKQYAGSMFNRLVENAMKLDATLSKSAAIALMAEKYSNLHERALCAANGLAYEGDNGKEQD
jgi:hypothetical protein